MSFAIPCKAAIVLAPVSSTNGETHTGIIDTLGYDFLTLDVFTTTSDSTANNPSVLKLTEGDTNAISSASAITEFTGDGAGGFTIPLADTDTPWLVKFNVDCRARKRYLFLSISPTTTQTLSAVANLFKGSTAPITAGNAGDDCKALVEG